MVSAQRGCFLGGMMFNETGGVEERERPVLAQTGFGGMAGHVSQKSVPFFFTLSRPSSCVVRQ